MKMNLSLSEVKEILNEKVLEYEQPSFIESDPISIPHRFELKEDIEISGFLTALIAWGNRKAILKSCNIMMNMLGNEPYNFVVSASDAEIAQLSKFVYRTFQGEDLPQMVHALRYVYQNDGLEKLMTPVNGENIHSMLIRFYSTLLPFLNQHARKHIANVAKNSAGKRLNMYLRWMVRSNERGVDFGLWKNISSASLMLPLDVHSANMSRYYGILTRYANDWKAVEEVTNILRTFCPNDPIRYDFALFGEGVSGFKL